jgi:hypothetical protein
MGDPVRGSLSRPFRRAEDAGEHRGALVKGLVRELFDAAGETVSVSLP